MLEIALFYFISFAVVAAAIGVVLSRSAVYSVLSLVASMCFLSGLFVLLKAYLVATILVLVYAGAILVLFLFVVMLIDFRKISTDLQGLGWKGLPAAGLGLLLFAEIARVIRTIGPQRALSVHGTAEAIGQLLFNRYLLPFELTSFLLLAAVVSVVVLAKKDAR